MMFVCGLSTYGQEFSVNAGTFLNHQSIPGIEHSQGDQAFMGYFEFSADFVKSDAFRLGPVTKMFFYDGGLGSAVNGVSNNYAFSGGLEAGICLGELVEFTVGFELPIPDQRDAIFEAVISPSLIFGDGEGLGFKVNYDYFINKQLFTYQSAISAGLIYQF